MRSVDRDLCLYAVADGGLPKRLRVLDRPLRAIPIGSISAVVGTAGERMPPTPEALSDQHAVVAALAERAGALLPARFGTRLPEGTLRARLTEHLSTLSASLDQVRGCGQMTVRVFGAPDQSRPPRVDGSGTAYLMARHHRARHLPAEMERIRSICGRLVRAERAEAGEGALRLTVFHLVPIAAAGEYRRQAPVLQTMLAPCRVLLSGPWPPFAFAPELF